MRQTDDQVSDRLRAKETERAMADAGGRSNDRYVLPREPSEVNRLDLQHFALHELLGTNHVAPLTNPRSVLDVGTGTGQWAADLSEEFGDALVVGTDQGPPVERRTEPRYHYVRINVLQGLPFLDGRFDYVHQRFLRSGIPPAAWPGVVRELARVTARGGVVELSEVSEHWANAGPAASRFFSLMRELGGSNGLDVEGPPGLDLAGFLRGADLEDVGERQVIVPVGEWGGRVGSFMASNLRAVGRVLIPLYASFLGVPEEESGALVSQMVREFDVVRMTGEVWYAWGRKPS